MKVLTVVVDVLTCCFSPFWLNLSPLWPQLSPFLLSPFLRVAGDQPWPTLSPLRWSPFRLINRDVNVVTVDRLQPVACSFNWLARRHGFHECLAYTIFARPNLRCELVRGRNVSRYEQLETSPEKIEQELPPVVCEHRRTNRFTENYSIDKEALNGQGMDGIQ